MSMQALDILEEIDRLIKLYETLNDDPRFVIKGEVLHDIKDFILRKDR